MTQYTLPALPYDYAALEPHISREIMELHHDRHHRAYVKGANDAVAALQAARSRDDFRELAALERALAFHVSGHVLHSIFWQNLTPDAAPRPQGPLAKALERDFGSFDLFKRQLVQTAMTIMGSGWGALVWDPITRRLNTAQIHDHQSQITQAGVPLLVLDAWEHAYYLQYRTEKGRYFEAVWNLWNWDDVAARLDRAQRLDMGLSHVAEGVTT